MSQSDRILQRLKQTPNEWVPMPTLSRIGSGKENGWVASFSRRISDLRQQGYRIEQRDIPEGSEYRLVVGDVDLFGRVA